LSWNSWERKGDFNAAKIDYSEALRLDPTDVRAHCGRANALLVTGDIDEAIKEYTDAIELGANSATPFYNRGLAWAKKGQIDNAINDYTEAIKVDDKYVDAYYARGNGFMKIGQFLKAIEDYGAAIKLTPMNARAYNRIAWLRATCPELEFRDGNDAVLMATKACDLTDWKNWANLDTLAAACAEQGDFDNAVNWQNKAIDLVTDESDKQIGRERLKLYEARKPYRDEAKK
jgi:tetratricopeptide (TPR) repeat protein